MDNSEYDPDLEVRLYAEIYYSNEETFEPEKNNLNNLESSTAVLTSHNLINEQSQSSENPSVINDYTYDVNLESEELDKWSNYEKSSKTSDNYKNAPSSSCTQANSLPYSHRKSLPHLCDNCNKYVVNANLSGLNSHTIYCTCDENNVLYDAHGDDNAYTYINEVMDYIQMVRSFRPKQTVNLHKNNSSPILNNYPKRIERRKHNGISPRAKRRRKQNISNTSSKNESLVLSVLNLLDRPVEAPIEIVDNSSADENTEASNEIVTINSLSKKTNKKKKKRETETRTDNKNIQNNDNNIDLPKDSDTATKYNVKEKQCYLKSLDDVIIDDIPIDLTDSEDSIFEIPVPPRPKPPVINLRDSCDSSSDENENAIVTSNDSDFDTSLGSLPCTNISGFYTITDDEDVDPNDVDKHKNSIVINCTRVQKGASSIEEIKKILESGILSEDSMTDSEALNWGAIEGQIVKNGPILHDNEDLSRDQDFDHYNRPSDPDSSNNVNKITDNELQTVDNENSVELLTDTVANSENNVRSEITPCLSLPSTSGIIKGQTINGGVTCETINEDASPEKILKKNNLKSTAEMSFEEYIHQPMPKHLEKFYSEFCVKEYMKDVAHIQSRMSRNPSKWAILDADIGPKHGVKRKRCVLCQSEYHKRDKCPQKRKIIVCHMCGENGHLETRCPYKMCLTCGTKYSAYRKTCEICKNITCTTCKSIGHSSTNCPDLWRRYHHTTESYDIQTSSNKHNTIKLPNKLFCCNCAKRGHDSTTCMRYRWSQHFSTPCFVTNYDQPPFYTSDTQIICNAKDTIKPSQSSDNSKQISTSSNASTSVANINVEDDTNSEVSNCYIDDGHSFTNSDNWYLEKIVPHEIPGVTYQFVHNTTSALLEFLRHHIPSKISYEITLKRLLLTDGYKSELTLKTLNKLILKKIKKIIIQWMLRKSDDRKCMKEIERLPIKQMELVNYLQTEWKNITQCTPLDVNKYTKIIACLRNRMKSKKKKFKEKKEIMKDNLLKFKKKLVNFAHAFLPLPNVTNILVKFRKLLDNLEKLPIDYNSHVPFDLYLDAVWYNLELFSPHLSQYIIIAAREYSTNESNNILGRRIVSNIEKIMFDKVNNDNSNAQVIDLTNSDGNSEENSSNKNITDENCTLVINDMSKKAMIRLRQKNNNSINTMIEKKILNKELDYKSIELMKPWHVAKGKKFNLNQLNYATAILAFVEENDLKRLKTKARKLVTKAQQSLLERRTVLNFFRIFKLIIAKKLSQTPSSFNTLLPKSSSSKATFN